MFTEILTDLMNEKGLNKRQLALKANIPPTTISGWYNANRCPDYHAIKKLCKFFDVSADYLLELDTEKRNPEARNEALINNSFNYNSGHLNVDIKK